jgi:hypothetical protein
MRATEFLLHASRTEPELREGVDLLNPEHGLLFFRELYKTERLDAANVQRELNSLNFANAAAAFHLIDDKFSRPIAVPWEDGGTRIEAFRVLPNRGNRRALQPYLVQVRKDFADALCSAGAIEYWQDYLGLPTGLFGGRYSDLFGFNLIEAARVDPELLLA